MLALGDAGHAGVDPEFQPRAASALRAQTRVRDAQRGFDHVGRGLDYMFCSGKQMADYEDRQTLREAHDPRNRWKGF